MPGKRVLLIEDQPSFALMYRELISAHNGFEFIEPTITRGDHALPAFLEHRPDIILVDVRLPLMDGIQVVRQIRKHDLLAPIVVITAFATRDTRAKALAAGANDFFAKPFNYRKLHRRMIELCEANYLPIQHIQAHVKNKLRRLQILEEKKAILGLSVPPEILMEAEDLQAELKELYDQ